MSAAEQLEAPEVKLTRAWIARQPILDRAGETFGYELLFRSSPANRADVADASQASAQTLLTAFTEVGLESLCGPRHKALFHLDDELLCSDALGALPKHRCLIYVERCPGPHEPLADRLRELSAEGYRLVIPATEPGADEVLHAAEYAALDMRAVSEGEFEARAQDVRRQGMRLLVRRVETHAEHERALAAGAELVQGFYFQVPEMISGTHIPADRRATLSLLAKVQSPDTPLPELERLIGGDVSLSYRLLRLLSTARFATAHKVDSVRRAVVMLGRRRLAKWVSLVALSGIDDRPQALLEQSIVRARMCEVLGERMPEHSPSTWFTVGLLSSIDAMLGRPLKLILSQISVTPELEDALLYERGKLGSVLAAVKDYQSGEWRAVDLEGIDPERLADAYFDAVRYSLALLAELGR